MAQVQEALGQILLSNGTLGTGHECRQPIVHVHTAGRCREGPHLAPQLLPGYNSFPPPAGHTNVSTRGVLKVHHRDKCQKHTLAPLTQERICLLYTSDAADDWLVV